MQVKTFDVSFMSHFGIQKPSDYDLIQTMLPGLREERSVFNVYNHWVRTWTVDEILMMAHTAPPMHAIAILRACKYHAPEKWLVFGTRNPKRTRAHLRMFRSLAERVFPYLI